MSLIKSKQFCWALTTAVILTAGCSTSATIDELPPIQNQISANVLWRKKMRVQNHDDWQAIDSNDYVFCSDDGHLSRLDLRNGESTWQIELLGEKWLNPSWDKELIVVVSELGQVRAYTYDKGLLLWETSINSEILTRPSISDQQIVIKTSDNRIIALDRKSGTMKWQQTSAQSNDLSLYASQGMSADQKEVFIGLPRGKLKKIDSSTGLNDWETTVSIARGYLEIERVNDVVKSPILTGEKVCAATFQGRIGCFQRKSGDTIWTQPFTTVSGLSSFSSTLVGNDLEQGPTLFNLENGEKIWQVNSLAGRPLTDPINLRDWVVVATQNKLIIIDKKSGQIISQIATDETVLRLAHYPQPDDQVHILVADRHGNLQLLKLDPVHPPPQ